MYVTPATREEEPSHVNLTENGQQHSRVDVRNILQYK